MRGVVPLAASTGASLVYTLTDLPYGSHTLYAYAADNDNLVSVSDFNILRNTFGKRSTDPGYDARADFNGDNLVSVTDFNLLKRNYGRSGALPIR